MDTITHTVLGACTGELIAGRKLGKKAMLIGAVMNNLPDIDMVANFWKSDAAALLSHRGITHSILFAVAATPLIAFILRRRVKNNTLSPRGWMLLVGHGLFLHIIMDAFTTYGTGWFEPFSHHRVSFNTLFILEPSFMLPLLIAFILLLILRSGPWPRRKIISLSALALSALYLLVTIFIKVHMNQLVRREITRNGWTAINYTESPTPFNNLMWYVIVKREKNFEVGYYSLLDKTAQISWYEVPQGDSLLMPYQADADVQNLLRFSKGYYAVRPAGSKLIFSDMRFGQTAMENLSNAEFVFNFDLIPAGKGGVLVKQSEFKELKKEDVSKLFRRIGGI
jgi:inner membrane protein